MLMESAGCAAVWLNGEWYVGNPYDLPNHKIVIPIEEGKNRLVVHLANPQARPKFIAPESDVLIDSALLPDAVVGESKEGKTLLLGPGSIRITNTTDQAINDALLVIKADGLKPVKTRVDFVAGLSTIETPIKLPEGKLESGNDSGKLKLKIELLSVPNKNQQEGDQPEIIKEQVLASYDAEVKLVSPSELRTETFLSKIDKSVQKYAYLPPKNAAELKSPPALAVLLHDAGEDVFQLIKQTESIDDVAQIAPYGRGLYGFDWEDWSAQDTLEAMSDLSVKFPFDSELVVLVGRGMGGHGALWIGCTNPNRFSTVSVSDAWLNLLLPSEDLPRDVMLKNLARMINRRANSSDLFELCTNLKNTPVRLYQSSNHQGTARAEMLELRSTLGGFHSNFAYRETEISLADQVKEAIKSARENANLRRSRDTDEIRFVSPGVEVLSESGWVKIEIPIQTGKLMQLQLNRDKEATLMEGTTENIRQLTLSLKGMKRAKRVKIKLDGQPQSLIAWPSRSSEITIERNEEGEWGTPKPARDGVAKESWKVGVETR